ncbi:TetR/AcrR family transcriptional regulator [Streptomyces sp. NPDC005181]|uniref:TetR/AcrR family transcriptional regulator n=1 Tax=Streptomyces sp. NPDC005181 TaxID=3156869 RepID=UPI0033A6FCCE
MATDRLDEVLDATYDCLTRYGVRRTTMDDIATTMGMSRSAVYQYVRSKDDAFRQLAGRLHDEVLVRARQAAADQDAPYTERIRGVLAVKLDLVLELSTASPHTAELLDAEARLFGGVCTAFTAALRRLLIGLFTETGTAEGVDPAEAADIAIALVIGMENMPDARRLLGPASGALTAGLLGATVVVR